MTRKGNNMDIVKVLMVAALFSAAFLFVELHLLHHGPIHKFSKNNSAPATVNIWLLQISDK
jgi:hypothetical protein